jgi:hypothetical protein
MASSAQHVGREEEQEDYQGGRVGYSSLENGRLPKDGILGIWIRPLD